MTGGASLLFTVALAIGGVAVLYVIYHVTSLSHSVIDVRAKMRRELAAKEEQFQDALRNSLEQQAEWARTEREQALSAMRTEFAEEQAAFRRETARTLEQLVVEVAALKVQNKAVGELPKSPTAITPSRDSKGRPQGSA